MLGFLWRATSGYRFTPWRSPYLRWRIETYQGTPADEIECKDFFSFVWRQRAELGRLLGWVRRNRG